MPRRQLTETEPDPPSDSLSEQRFRVSEPDAAAAGAEVYRRQRALLAWLERFALMSLVILFATKGLLPAWRQVTSDFPNYYVVARLYRAHMPVEKVYDWIWLQREKDRLGLKGVGVVGFVPLTLPSMLPILPLTEFSPLAAKRIWTVVNLLCLFAIAELLRRITRLSRRRIAILIFLAFIPLSANFYLGQVHVLVLLLVVSAAWLAFTDRNFCAGVVLALAAALKIYPALFLIYFVWKRQWRAAAGLTVGALGVAMSSLALFGWQANLYFVRCALPAGLRGETIDPYAVQWNSWIALLRRLFIYEPELNPSPLVHAPALYSLLHPLIHGFMLIAFLWAIGRQRRDAAQTKIEWGLFLFMLLFVSSQPAPYHFVSLILTVCLIADQLLLQGRTRLLACVVAVYAVIGAPLIKFAGIPPAGWANILFFSRLAALTLWAPLLLWSYSQQPRVELRSRFNRHNAALALSALLLVVVAGFAANQKHLRGQFDNYSMRIATQPGDVLANEPALNANSLFFTRLIAGRYIVAKSSNGSLEDFSETGGDWFHPSVAGNRLWVEQAARESRVTELSVDSVTPVLREEPNAEQPVVSSDGQWLAFSRPVLGRNTLWLRSLSAHAPTTLPTSRIVGEDYDPQDAAFLPDYRLVFSSRRSGQYRLYVADRAGHIDPLQLPQCSARYPAVSPDGRWMAFTCDQGAYSQLFVSDLAGRQQEQLTSAECNSVNPAWAADSKRIVFATDCGRGLGLTALGEVAAFH